MSFSNLSTHKIKRATISSSSSSVDLIAAVTAKSIRIISMVLKSSGAGTVVFNSASTEIGRITFTTADPPVVMGANDDGWLQTVVAEKFNLGNASTLTLSGFVNYVEL